MTKTPIVKKTFTPPVSAERDDAQPVPIAEDFWADERRTQALELFLEGVPKMQIAKRLHVHRNTINNWCADPRFVAELNQRHREHVSAKRVRRLMASNVINDINESVVVALGQKLKRDLKINPTTGMPEGEMNTDTDKLIRRYREMGYEFREMREHERIDIGDDVKKVAINQQHTLTGDVTHTHHGINATPFADYVRKAIDDKVIDVTAIEITDGSSGGLLMAAAEHVLVDTDLLDRINEEDLAEEAARK